MAISQTTSVLTGGGRTPGVSVRIWLDEAQLADIRRELGDCEGQMPAVLARAVNKVGVAARTKIIRAVTGEVNLKASDVRQKNVSLSKASYRDPTARIHISGRRVPLKSWGARQIGRGVSYAITRGGRKTVLHAFGATMKSGHLGIFIRSGQPKVGQRLRRGRGPGRGMTGLVRPRLPIRELFGPSVPEVVRGLAELSANVLDQQIREGLDKEITTQIGLVLSRRGRVQ